MKDPVRMALAQSVSLPVSPEELGDNDNLFDAGLSSFDLINLITFLEDQHGLEFPPEFMDRDHFKTIGRIQTVLAALTEKSHVL